VKIYCDGWAVNDGGPDSPCGYVITGEGVNYKYQTKGKSNNYCELRAIAKAVDILVKHKISSAEIYTDSAVALTWINSGVKKARNKEELLVIIKFIKKNLINNPGILLKKWDTALYGEIPADPGRK